MRLGAAAESAPASVDNHPGCPVCTPNSSSTITLSAATSLQTLCCRTNLNMHDRRVHTDACMRGIPAAVQAAERRAVAAQGTAHVYAATSV